MTDITSLQPTPKIIPTGFVIPQTVVSGYRWSNYIQKGDTLWHYKELPQETRRIS